MVGDCLWFDFNEHDVSTANTEKTWLWVSLIIGC